MSDVDSVDPYDVDIPQDDFWADDEQVPEEEKISIVPLCEIILCRMVDVAKKYCQTSVKQFVAINEDDSDYKKTEALLYLKLYNKIISLPEKYIECEKKILNNISDTNQNFRRTFERIMYYIYYQTFVFSEDEDGEGNIKLSETSRIEKVDNDTIYYLVEDEYRCLYTLYSECLKLYNEKNEDESEFTGTEIERFIAYFN